MGEVETRLMWMFISNISGFFICLGLGFFYRKEGRSYVLTKICLFQIDWKTSKKSLNILKRKLSYNDIDK